MCVWLYFARNSTLTLLLLCSFVSPIHAQRREEDDRPRGSGRRGRPEENESPPPPRHEKGPPDGRDRGFYGGPQGPYRSPEPANEMTARQGFVFINGRYIAPPYEIRLDEGVLTVNGEVLSCHPPQRGYGGRGFGFRGENSWRFMVGEIYGHLTGDLVILSFSDQPYLALDGSTTYDLLKAMTAEGGRALRQLTVREQLPAEFDRKIWDQWLESFEPPGELLQRAAVLINKFEDNQRAAESDMRASRLLNQMAYPLAVGGMVLSVLAVGHLLGGRPHARQRIIGLDTSPEMIQSLNWSLMLVAAFSLMDLAWTILAANAGQMHELNPIGSHLIENPRHLAGYKIGITMPSLAVLWLLRKHKRAQVAAWWLCLILTFVTLRWLTFSPLMAG